MPKPSPIALRLKRLRLAASLTQFELAMRADVSPTTVAALEQGTTRGSPRIVRKIARALGKAPSDLSGPSRT